MSGFDISYAGALGGGILSFVSPCVLPLVPAYLCFLGGTSLEQLAGDQAADAGARGESLSRRYFLFLVFLAFLSPLARLLPPLAAAFCSINWSLARSPV